MEDKQYSKVYTDADFGEMGWHDCRIHGISLWNPQDGYDFNLVLDLDYILDWFQLPGQVFEFNVAPARVNFFYVDKLKIDVRLRYKESLEIYNLEREEITNDSQRDAGMKIYQWKIILNSNPSDQCVIAFEATGFKLVLTKAPVRIGRQYLT